jgi:UDP-N-acetylmuramoyl-tripeptide--D-alanyl-D-alanine ligase
MWDYDYLQEMSKGIQTIYKYGSHDADIIGTVWKSDPLLEVKFSKGFLGSIQTRLVGSYNLPNVLATVTIGKFFGVPDEKIKSSIEDYIPSNSRSQLMQKGSNKIILDAYNANPSSMKLAVENFANAPGNNKVLVLGAMAELGEESVKEHQNIIDIINEHPWQNVLLIGGDFAKLKHGHIQLPSSAEAGEWLRKNKISDAYLLIKGSRSTQMEKVLDYLES